MLDKRTWSAVRNMGDKCIDSERGRENTIRLNGNDSWEQGG